MTVTPAVPAAPGPGPWARVAAVFVRPAQAWDGLESRALWWLPMLLSAVVTSVTMMLVYERSYLPMMTEGMERQVADGQMSAQQLERTEAFFAGPVGRAINTGFQLVGWWCGWAGPSSWAASASTIASRSRSRRGRAW